MKGTLTQGRNTLDSLLIHHWALVIPTDRANHVCVDMQPADTVYHLTHLDESFVLCHKLKLIIKTNWSYICVNSTKSCQFDSNRRVVRPVFVQQMGLVLFLCSPASTTGPAVIARTAEWTDVWAFKTVSPATRHDQVGTKPVNVLWLVKSITHPKSFVKAYQITRWPCLCPLKLYFH